MRLARCGYWLSLLAVTGMILPVPLRAAETAPSGSLPIDVALADDGSLYGVVIGAGGETLSGVPIAVRLAGAESVRLVTDRQGRFRAIPSRGGLCQVTAGPQTTLFRVWTPGTAPPGAGRLAVVVEGPPTVRGQTPLPSYFRSEAFLIGGVIAGAIAIPILIHNFRNDQPGAS
jgi:hypothetical protein